MPSLTAASDPSTPLLAPGKPRLGIANICNVSFGFFGIQIAFALQNGKISRIFQTLGASIDQLPILWIAGPLTGFVVQPVVGYLSDRTWCAFGRRRPYFLGGALASAIALAVLPVSQTLWLAVPAFWLLDIALNVTMEPFRAFVGDMLPSAQRTAGYAAQTIFIGAGALAASAAPYVFSHAFGISSTAPAGIVPQAVRLAFYVGAAALLGAVAWTVATTREYAPSELAAFARAEPDAQRQSQTERPGRLIPTLLDDLKQMPREMRRLAVIQFFSWCALFIMWIYATPVVAVRHFGSAAAGSIEYNAAGDWVGVLFATYNAVAAAYAFVLPALARRIGRERLHALNLLAGAAGLASVMLTHDPQLLLLSMVGVGIAWASILTMPYAMLCGAIPYAKFGTYMGIFNFFVVLPQLVVAGVMGWIVRALFPADPSGVMLIGGLSLAVSAAISWRKVRHE